jgi:DNA-binding CsgD family transcriptional regulator
LGARAVLRASRGTVDDARDDATRAEATATQVGLVLPVLLAAEALGLLALAHGDAAAADAAMAEHAERAVQAGVVELGAQRILRLEVEALVRLRRLDAARDLMRTFERRPARSDHSSASVAGRRNLGLLLAAAGEFAAAEDELGEAVRVAEKLGMPFEYARTLLIAGEIHRRARHRRLAQERVTAARAIFDELGSALWSARCGDELARVSGKPRPAVGPAVDGLTATEQRVADLAAEGLTTREIAGALFTGVRTVEAHLHHVYRKLGVRSRVELSRLLGERGATT